MIPVFKPLIEKEEKDASVNALDLGWLGMGSFVNDFESSLKQFTQCNDRHVAAVSTGHAALHIALMIAGVQPGDEVITPSFNNIADLQAILAVGANPVFCDIEEESLCIDLKKAAALVTAKTKVMIVMDYDCILCDHDGVAEFARKHKIRIIHDAAHSFGSKYKGKMIGSFSDITMFSFDPVKTITCIDGGALIVRTKEELEQIHEMRLIGMGQPATMMYENKRAWTYDVKRLGFRYHMANLHAAIGLAQIAKMNKIGESRRMAGLKYNQELASVKGIITPKSDFVDIVPFLYYIRVLNGKREELIKFLKENGVDTGIHWQPGHWFSLFKNEKCGDLTVTETIGKEILSLPLHSLMKEEDIIHVVKMIKLFFEK
ncbi:MAG: DegT/DnrJ/EryC1/StrS family aminotransferase [Flavobacteriales bacterium]